MSCPTIKLKIINENKIKKIIKKIESSLKIGKYQYFPYYIEFQFNKLLDTEDKDLIEKMCISTIKKFITLDVLKNDKIVSIKLFSVNKYFCKYIVDLTPEFKKATEELKILDKEHIEEFLRRVNKYAIASEYFKFPIYTYCEFNRSWTKDEYEFVKNMCYLTTINALHSLEIKNLFIIEPYYNPEMLDNQFGFKIDLTDEYRELLKKRYESKSKCEYNAD